MEAFIKLIAPYKEFILIIIAAMGGVFFVRDYFATKEDVRILKCQMQNEVALTDSKIAVDGFRKSIISLEQQIEESIDKNKKLKGPAAKAADQVTAALKLDLDTAKSQLNQAYATHDKSNEILMNGACEKEVVKK